jgi:hypothetical protein
MARLFTTPFSFREIIYTAFVSITTCNGEQTISIILQDETLHRLVPGGKFTFDARKGVPVDYPLLTEAQELLLSVMVAIEAQGIQLTLPSHLQPRF